MSMEDVVKSLLTETTGSGPDGKPRQPAAGVDDGSMAAEKDEQSGDCDRQPAPNAGPDRRPDR